MHKLEITINIIVHATEDISKFFERFSEIYGLENEIFSVSKVTGHFENPISIISTKITKKNASQFLEKLLNLLTEDQKNQIFQEIEKRTADSAFHLRLDKQRFVQGKVEFQEKDAIKIKIQTPIYNKKNTFKVFREIFEQVN